MGYGYSDKRRVRIYNVDSEGVERAVKVSEDGKMFTDSYLVDTDGTPVGIDANTRAIYIVDYAHHEAHAGSAFVAEDVEDVPNSSTFDYAIVTPDTTKHAHMIVAASSNLGMQIDIYEDATLSDNGTLIPSYNRNRNIATAATTLVYHTPTVTATGSTIIFHRRWGDAVKQGTGGGARGQNELILKQNTTYLVRFTNQVADTNLLDVLFDYYEHTSKA